MNYNLSDELIYMAITVSFILILSYGILPKNRKTQGVFRKYKILHPNSISIARLIAGTPLVFLFHYGIEINNHLYSNLAMQLYVFFAITDALDGAVAKFCDLMTIVGQKLDALADKFFDSPFLLYFSYSEGPIFFIAAIAIITFNIIGQWIRGRYSSNAAGLAGKIKTTITFILIYFMSLHKRFPDIYYDWSLNYFVPMLLLAATILAGVSMSMKTKWFNDNIEEYIKRVMD